MSGTGNRGTPEREPIKGRLTRSVGEMEVKRRPVSADRRGRRSEKTNRNAASPTNRQPAVRSRRMRRKSSSLNWPQSGSPKGGGLASLPIARSGRNIPDRNRQEDSERPPRNEGGGAQNPLWFRPMACREMHHHLVSCVIDLLVLPFATPNPRNEVPPRSTPSRYPWF